MIDDNGAKLRPNPFDDAKGYSGQEYHRDKEAAFARIDPSGQVHPGGPSRAAENDPRADIGPEAGRRASVDPATGELHGAGSNEGEEYDPGLGA